MNEIRDSFESAF